MRESLEGSNMDDVMAETIFLLENPHYNVNLDRTKEQVAREMADEDGRYFLAGDFSVYSKDGVILPQHEDFFQRSIEHEYNRYMGQPYLALVVAQYMRKQREFYKDVNDFMKEYGKISQGVKKRLEEKGIDLETGEKKDATTGTPSNQDAGRVREGTPSGGV